MSSVLKMHNELHTSEVSNKLNVLRASVLGVSDGIISIAALVVGVASASATSHTLLLTGVAGILAGAFSMTVGEYVSVSSQRDSERALLAQERYELEHEAELELEELTAIYEKKGLTRNTAQQVAHELTEHDALTAHAHAELGIDPNNLTNPVYASLSSGVSYALGGIVPLLAIVYPPADTRIITTFIGVCIALIIAGVVSARVSGAPIGRTTFRVVAGGLLAMTITFVVGYLFTTLVI